ncbi:MAG: hypothetical protein E7387_01120 [Ruminococcaceae bacterium]|nr:hypothetical protein [Oscillospiraceae bacterium]
MEENNIFQEPKEITVEEGGKKPLDTTALVLGIVAIAAALFIPLISYACGIIGLIFSIKHRKEKRTKAALILCIIGLICGLASHVYSMIVILGTLETII